MKLLDEHYLEHPYKGARSIHNWLTKDKGFTSINRNRVDRLYYRVMGLSAIDPGVHTSERNKRYKVFPYLLMDLVIDRHNQV